MPEQLATAALGRWVPLAGLRSRLRVDPAATPAAPFVLKSTHVWGLLAALLVLEWSLFHQFIERDVTGVYPTNHDQTGYLHVTYDCYEVSRDVGLKQSLWHTFRSPSANGVMLPIQGTLMLSVLGPSRHSALTLNFVYFVALQLALFWACRWGTKRWWPAFVALGLLLSAHSPWLHHGALCDFRIDFIAMCLYGLCVCAVLRSDLFANYRWAAAAGLVAALLVLFRFITAVYLAGLGLSLLAYLGAALWWAWRDAERRALATQRLRGAGLAATVLLVLTLPVLWSNRVYITDYYVENHILGSEKTLRAEEQNVYTNLDHLAFYPTSLAADHLGKPFLWLSGGLLIVAVAALWRRRQTPPDANTPFARGHTGRIWLAASAALVPLAALTADEAKSPIVVNVMVPALAVGVVVLLWAAVDGRAGAWLTRALAVVAMAVGLGQLLTAANARQPIFGPPDQRRLLELHDCMVDECQDKQISHPQVGFNLVAEHLNVGTLSVLAYERRQTRLAPTGLLCSMNERDPAGIWPALEQCQLVVLTDRDRRSDFHYPGNRQMLEYYPEMLHYCRTAPHFYPLTRQRLDTGEDIQVFGRHSLRLDTHGEHHWLTTKGIDLHDTRGALRTCPRVQLDGTAPFGSFSVRTVEVRAGKRVVQTVVPQLTLSGEKYRLEFEVDPALLPVGETELSIHLEFDRPEVPEKTPKWCKDRGHRVAMVSPFVPVYGPGEKK